MKLKQEQKSSAIDCLSFNLLFRAVRFPIKTEVQTHNFELSNGCLCMATCEYFKATSIHCLHKTKYCPENTAERDYSMRLSPWVCVCVGRCVSNYKAKGWFGRWSKVSHNQT